MFVRGYRTARDARRGLRRVWRLGPGRWCSRGSESLFKTMKYLPVFPDQFVSLTHARQFLDDFVTAYNHHHRQHHDQRGRLPAPRRRSRRGVRQARCRAGSGVRRPHHEPSTTRSRERQAAGRTLRRRHRPPDAQTAPRPHPRKTRQHRAAPHPSDEQHTGGRLFLHDSLRLLTDAHRAYAHSGQRKQEASEPSVLHATGDHRRRAIATQARRIVRPHRPQGDRKQGSQTERFDSLRSLNEREQRCRGFPYDTLGVEHRGLEPLWNLYLARHFSTYWVVRSQLDPTKRWAHGSPRDGHIVHQLNIKVFSAVECRAELSAKIWQQKCLFPISPPQNQQDYFLLHPPPPQLQTLLVRG
ncbi:hypothetical protein SAMN02745244_02504 [Tessaracoccus bendigoensis DSM 12906]|uniref:Integrase catalytic domain-containing protein n=1 Tax=Tessaracoccus bendigoensis DSM 12906 TaxID=1123357 RepID=A0A1M6J9X2_9ACTN|nr:hypothetical protein SAMN02745244_02504 [Tessaracoccus bendigoensis DSM 12906]